MGPRSRGWSLLARTKRAIKGKADVQAALFGLVVDVKGAHNLVPVREEDPRHQCCRVGEGGGMPACKYKRSGRSAWGAPPTAGNGHPIRRFQPRVLLALRDDFDVEAAGLDFRATLFVVFEVASVVGIPIAWKKVRGGIGSAINSACGSIESEFRQVGPHGR